MKTESTIQLAHGQEIRVTGFPSYAQRITIRTCRGCAVQHKEDPEAAHIRALDRGHETAWANQEPAALTSDYAGKAEAMAAEAVATAAAVEIASGDHVEIEGELFRVRVMGQQFSDPVHFIRL